MTIRLSRAAGRAAVFEMAALGCLLAAAGCQTGPDGKSAFPEVKNPFHKGTAAADAQQANAAPRSGPDLVQGIIQGRELEKTDKLAEARQVYQNLIVKYPDRYEPYHRLAVVADRQKRFREAQALYSQAIQLHPDSDLFGDLGYSFYLDGKLEKAEPALLKAVAMQPANPRFRNNLGMVYGFEGHYDEAMEQFRHGGSEADAFCNMAFILSARDDPEAAKKCLRLALAADPSHKNARKALQSLEQGGAGDLASAVASTGQNDGRRWVPYVEGGDQAQSGAQTASYTAPTTPNARKANGPLVPSTRPDTQALLHRAHSMMSERMAERPSAEVGGTTRY